MWPQLIDAQLANSMMRPGNVHEQKNSMRFERNVFGATLELVLTEFETRYRTVSI